MRQSFIISLVCIFLVGCASGANQEAMVPIALSADGANPKFTRSINVQSVGGGQATNPLWTSQISSGAFKTSLENALKARGYLDTGGPQQLTATLLDLKQPFAGTDLTVTSKIRYQLTGQNGEVLFDQTISASYTAAFGDSLLAVERLRLANEGSARTNVRMFIEALDRA